MVLSARRRTTLVSAFDPLQTLASQLSLGPMTPGTECVERKLHPQTAFMIFFPGFCLLCVFVLLAFSHSPGRVSGMEGIAAVIGIGVVAISFGLWSDFGHAICWDTMSLCTARRRRLVLRPPPL